MLQIWLCGEVGLGFGIFNLLQDFGKMFEMTDEYGIERYEALYDYEDIFLWGDLRNERFSVLRCFVQFGQSYIFIYVCSRMGGRLVCVYKSFLEFGVEFVLISWFRASFWFSLFIGRIEIFSKYFFWENGFEGRCVIVFIGEFFSYGYFGRLIFRLVFGVKR